ncbi:MAG: PP2C family protein-serine/threonine phosphatase [Anaerolineales bacterium]
MIPSQQSHLAVAAVTHPGMQGKNNEDRFSVSAFHLGEQDKRRALLVVVADGVGGHQAGEIAAELAVEQISQRVAEYDGADPVAALREAAIFASRKIRSRALADSELVGMAATCVCALIIENQLYAVSAGDSRLYLLRDGHILQLTTDHTWIQEALDGGYITPEEASRHPNQHVIRRYLGSQKLVEPDTRLRLRPQESDADAQANQGLRLNPGDFVLLCTDGLTDLVQDEEIYAALQRDPLETALSGLVDLANQRGGHDNITIAALRMPPEPRGASKRPARKPRWPWVVLILLLGAALCLAAAFSAYFLFQISNNLLGFGG